MGLAGLLDLPWNRVGVWAVVIWFMYSLKDFFGVSGTKTGFPSMQQLVLKQAYLYMRLQSVLI